MVLPGGWEGVTKVPWWGKVWGGGKGVITVNWRNEREWHVIKVTMWQYTLDARGRGGGGGGGAVRGEEGVGEWGDYPRPLVGCRGNVKLSPVPVAPRRQCHTSVPPSPFSVGSSLVIAYFNIIEISAQTFIDPCGWAFKFWVGEGTQVLHKLVSEINNLKFLCFYKMS